MRTTQGQRGSFVIPALFAAICIAGAVAWFIHHHHGQPSHAAAQAASAPAAAKTAAKLPPLASVQAAIHQASHGTVKGLSTFPGPDGLIGAVIASTADTTHRDIVWLTPDLKAIVVNGHLVDAEGGNLTQQARYTQKILLRPADVLAKAGAPEMKSIVIGESGPMMTVFFDPNCIYCHLMYASLAPSAVAGKLRMRIVLVGIIKASSAPRAASILMADDTRAALASNEKDFDQKHEEGGFPVADPVSGSSAAAAYDASRAVVAANTALFERSGSTGTPTLFFCSRDTKRVEMRSGLPSDASAVIEHVAPMSYCHS